jgi:molecular chaperone GrpE
MTAKALHKALGKHHVQRFQPQPGEALDPNCMSALFQLPVAGQEKGTVAVVTKSGYRLNERVIRPAEVGVVA